MKKYTALSAEPYTPTSDESRADTEELTREEVRAMLTEEGTAFRVQAVCIRAYGPEAGVMIQHLVYLDGKGFDRNDWIYKPEHEWTDETGLSRHAQRKGRKRAIGAGVWEEEKRGIPAKNYYRLNIWKVWADVAPYLEGPQNGESISQATIVASQVRRVKEPSKSGDYSDLTINKETSEETFKDFKSGAASAAPHRNLNEVKEYTKEHHDQDQDDTATTFVSSDAKTFANGKPYNAPRVTEVLEKLLTHFDLVPEGFNEHERGRYKKRFKELIDDGVEPEQMFAVVLHMLERWQAISLAPRTAYNDVRGGKSEHRSMNEDEFMQGVNGRAANGTTGARGSRLPASEGSGKGPVPQRPTWRLHADTVYLFRGNSREIGSEDWPEGVMLNRIYQLIQDEGTESGRAFARFLKYGPVDGVVRTLWDELRAEEYNDQLVAGQYVNIKGVIRQAKEERVRLELADELAEIAERRERELAEERERELAE